MARSFYHFRKYLGKRNYFSYSHSKTHIFRHWCVTLFSSRVMETSDLIFSYVTLYLIQFRTSSVAAGQCVWLWSPLRTWTLPSREDVSDSFPLRWVFIYLPVIGLFLCVLTICLHEAATDIEWSAAMHLATKRVSLDAPDFSEEQLSAKSILVSSEVSHIIGAFIFKREENI